MKFTVYYVCVYRNGDLREKRCVKGTDAQINSWPNPIFDLITQLSQRFGWENVEYRVTRKDDEMAKDRNIKKGNKKPRQKTLKDRKREKREKREKEKKQI